MAKIFQKDTNGTLLTSLVSYWKMEGDSTDFFGTNNGTDTAVTYSTANGKIGQGASFNGTTSKIINSNASLAISPNISISVWVNITALPTSGNLASVVAKYDTAANVGGYDLRFYNNAGTQELDFVLKQNSGTATTLQYFASLTTGVWHHLLATSDNVTAKIYVDGTLAASLAGAGPGSAGTQDFCIGCINLSGIYSRFFNGSIDEVGIWSKALSAQEISDLYNGGSGQTMIIPPFGGTMPLLGV